MTREERLDLLRQIEKDIHVCSLESTFLDDAKSCAIHSVIDELEQEPIEVEAAKLQEAYNKGYADGQRALAEHIELCKEEQEPTAKENLVVAENTTSDCISREDAIKLFNTVLVFGKADAPTEEIMEDIRLAIETMRKYQMLQADYEARLKADMVAMLTEIQLEIEDLDPNYECNTYYAAIRDCSNLTQQKIDKLKEVEQ